jgi:GNAT superfamily N-acetyltransferase
MISFRRNVPTSETMVFEEVFAENLQMETVEEKEELLEKALTVWMFVDGKIAGETYGYAVPDIDEDIPGVEGFCFSDGKARKDNVPEQTFYMYSTAILPEFQRKGYARILKSYMLGVVSASSYLSWSPFETVIGHSHEGGSLQLNLGFGAKTLAGFSNWYDTGKTYYMYRLDLR